MRELCPNDFEGCPELIPYSDEHHLYKEADADTALKKLYCNLGVNAIQLCRCVHRELEATEGWLPYPNEDVMLDIIESEVSLGNLNLSRAKRKKIGFF